MRVIPAAVLTPVVGLLHPYVPGLTEPVLLQALQAIGTAPATISDPAARRLLSLKEAGRATGFSEWTMRRMVIRGLIEGRKVGVQWRIPVSAIEELARAHTAADGQGGDNP